MKNLLTSLRASNETYNSMKHSARAIIRRAEIPLLAVIVLYKAATNLLFVPLMQQLWSLTLRFAPMHYLSNNNASDIFSSPAIILCITLIAILTAFWALYEFSVLLHGLDLARKGETIRLPALLRTSLADIRHAFLPQNWLVLVYSAVLIPFTNFFLAYNYITQLAVPEYIMGVIRANSRYYLLYLAAGAALLFLCVSWVLVLPLFVLERKSLWQSVKESFCCIRRRVFRAFLLLLRWNLSVVLRSLLLTAAVAVPLYGIIIAVGLQSTQAMFALSRAALESVPAGQLEAAEGAEFMAQNRFGCGLSALTPYQRKNFLNGPGKVCRAFSLTRAQNGLDLTGDTLFLWDAGETPEQIHVGKRIGIDYAEEAADFPWRFYL
mgnify:CR=1 FL=1